MFKANKQQRNFVNKALEHLRHKLYLQGWDIQVHYMDGPNVEAPNSCAATQPNSAYLTVTISIFPCFFDQPKERWNEMLIHELCHIYADSYKEMWERMANGILVTRQEEALINERVVSMFTRVACDAYLKELKKIV